MVPEPLHGSRHEVFVMFCEESLVPFYFSGVTVRRPTSLWLAHVRVLSSSLA